MRINGLRNSHYFGAAVLAAGYLIGAGLPADCQAADAAANAVALHRR